MTSPSIDSAGPSRTARRVSYVLSVIVVLFLTFDTVVKLAMAQAAVEGTVKLGYSASIIRPLGIIELICLVLYLIPRSAPFGALLWTGYLGGAVASNVHQGSPFFTFTLAPVYVALLLWGALWLRDSRVRNVLSATHG